ncbi:MAG TPA: hypothetical protein VJA21_24150 [Verrucomicrobiae bacterium]
MPEGRFKVAIPGEQIFEELNAEKLDSSIEQRTIIPDQPKPPVSLARKHARDLQDLSREFCHWVVLMSGEGVEASNILR